MTTVTLNLEALLTRLERAGLLHLVGDGRVWDAAAADLRADYGDAVTVGLELPEPAVIEDEPGPWTYWLACSCPSCGHTVGMCCACECELNARSIGQGGFEAALVREACRP